MTLKRSEKRRGLSWIAIDFCRKKMGGSYAEIRAWCKQICQKRDAATQDRNLAFGKSRQGRASEEPKASDRDRPFGSPKKGCKGSEKKGLTVQLLVHRVLGIEIKI